MIELCKITFIGIIRDKVFQGIMMLAVLFLFIPSAASLSMRQVAELAITLSLTLVSFIQLLLAVFLGATVIWRDIDRKNAFSVLSLPVSRASYVLGRFLGVASFLLLVALVFCIVVIPVVHISSTIYPPNRPIVWGYIVMAILFITLRSILLVAVAMAFSTVSTSFFLPIFGTISVYLAGEASQQVKDYLFTLGGSKTVSPVFTKAALAIYYLLPNLSSLDLKVNAIYAISPTTRGAIITLLYATIYIAILLSMAALLFSRREIR